MEKGYALLDAILALTITIVIIGILVSGNGTIFSIQKENNSYHDSIIEFSNHLESLYEKDWDNLKEENNKYFKSYYDVKQTDYNTIQLKVTGEIENNIIEVSLEKPSAKIDNSKPIPVIDLPTKIKSIRYNE